MRKFHHVGLPTDEPQAGEVYVPETKVWVTEPLDHPHRVEYLRYEPDSPASGPVREQAHLAFETDDLAAEIAGKEVILGPFEAMPGLTVVFVLEDGAVFEFMYWADGRQRFGA
jgi:hypothetical protein